MWRIWAGLVYKRATGDPIFLVQNECDRSSIGPQSILMKDHFMGTAKTATGTFSTIPIN